MQNKRDAKKISGILETFKKAEKLKSVLRCAYTSDSKRKESSADHSWMLALLAIFLLPEVGTKIDQLKVLKMLILHDLAEAIVGDSYPWETRKRINKHEREKKALKEIVTDLSKRTAHVILALWLEFEKKENYRIKICSSCR